MFHCHTIQFTLTAGALLFFFASLAGPLFFLFFTISFSFFFGFVGLGLVGVISGDPSTLSADGFLVASLSLL